LFQFNVSRGHVSAADVRAIGRKLVQTLKGNAGDVRLWAAVIASTAPQGRALLSSGDRVDITSADPPPGSSISAFEVEYMGTVAIENVTNEIAAIAAQETQISAVVLLVSTVTAAASVVDRHTTVQSTTPLPSVAVSTTPPPKKQEKLTVKTEILAVAIAVPISVALVTLSVLYIFFVQRQRRISMQAPQNMHLRQQTLLHAYQQRSAPSAPVSYTVLGVDVPYATLAR
jgi:hypothetical protein